MVSIIIPAYNSEDTIKSCVVSALGQTSTDIEVIVIDDGSTDRTPQICDELAETDHRLVVIHQTNKGRSEARWKGVSIAKGQWIAFLDSDDKLNTDAIQRLVQAADVDYDIVFGNAQSVFNPVPAKIDIETFRHHAVRGDGTIGVPWGSLYKKQLLEKSDFDLPREIYNGEDYIFWLRIIFRTDKPIALLKDSIYDKGEEHTSNSFIWTADYAYRLNEFRMASIPQENLPLYLNDTIADRLVNLAAVAICQQKREWIHSQFYKDIINDLKAINSSIPIKTRIFLSIPSLSLRRFISHLINRLK